MKSAIWYHTYISVALYYNMDQIFTLIHKNIKRSYIFNMETIMIFALIVDKINKILKLTATIISADHLNRIKYCICRYFCILN